MKFGEWFKTEMLESATMWIWFVLAVLSTVMLFMGKITGDQWVVFQPVAAGIALAKRATTQAITNTATKPEDGK